MTLQPDHPDFTAAVLGEAPNDDLAGFETVLAMDQQSLAEASGLRLAASRLRTALKQDPALKNQLTPAQRAAVLDGGGEVSGSKSHAASSRERALIPFPRTNSPIPGTRNPVSAFPAPAAGAVLAAASGTSPAAERTRSSKASAAKKRPLSSPAAIAAGLAAAVALGLFFLSGTAPDPASAAGSTTQLLPASGQPAKPQPQGIPAIALDPVAVSGTPLKTGISTPGLPVIPKKDPVIFPGSPLENPAAPGFRAPAIATTPPEIRLTAPGAAPAAGNPPSGPLTEVAPVPGAPPRRGAVSETLANPGGR